MQSLDRGSSDPLQKTKSINFVPIDRDGEHLYSEEISILSRWASISPNGEIRPNFSDNWWNEVEKSGWVMCVERGSKKEEGYYMIDQRDRVFVPIDYSTVESFCTVME